MTPRRWLVAALAGVAVVLLIGRVAADAYTGFAWYQSMGAVAVWRARTVTVLAWGTLIWAIAALYTFGHLYGVRQSIASLVLRRRLGNLEIGAEVPGRFLTAAAAGVAALVALALAAGWNDWTTVMLARRGALFGETDPYFQADLGFFVYWLPFELDLWAWMLSVVIAVGLIVVMLYVVTTGIWMEEGRVRVSSHARRHFGVTLGILLLLLAWRYRLDMYDLLLGGGDGSFGYLDHRVGIPGHLVLAVATLCAGAFAIWASASGQFRLAISAGVLVGALWLIVHFVAPSFVDEQARAGSNDRAYQATEAAYTRRAYAADRVRDSDSATVFSSLAEAAPRVSLWDVPALRRAIDPSRADDTTGIWVSWRAAEGVLVADVVTSGGEGRAAPWAVRTVNAAAVDEGGAPVTLPWPRAGRDGVEPQRSIPAPLVYPGASGYAVVDDSLRQVTGVTLRSLVSRLAHAWSLQNPRFATDSVADARRVVVTHRDVRERIDRLAPFFTQGSIITPIVAGDSLYWVLDLYSASATYPLSRRSTLRGRTVTYLHHAATAVVHAATGEVTLVADRALDPVAITWVQRFQTLFGSWSSLPPAVVMAVPPALDGAVAQAVAFGRFGTRSDSDVPRHLPVVDGADAMLTSPRPPVALPDGSGVVLHLPLLDDNDRLRGVIVASGGAAAHTAWLPRQSTLRWPDLLERLTAVDSSVAPESAERGNRIRGTVRVIPVGEAVDVVQPVFSTRPQGGLTFDAVLIADEDTAWRAHALDERGSAAGPTTPSGDLRSVLRRLTDRMDDALRRGDWTAFGAALDSLRRLSRGSPR